MVFICAVFYVWAVKIIKTAEQYMDNKNNFPVPPMLTIVPLIPLMDDKEIHVLMSRASLAIIRLAPVSMINKYYPYQL